MSEGGRGAPPQQNRFSVWKASPSSASSTFSMSKMKGVADIDQVTPSVFMSSMASRAWKSCCSTARPPRSIGETSPWKNPVAWFKGDGMNMTSASVRSSSRVNTRSENKMLLWVSMACLGLPVVPEVGRMQATESAETGAKALIGSKRTKISAKVGKSVWLGACLSSTAMGPRLGTASRTAAIWAS